MLIINTGGRAVAAALLVCACASALAPVLARAAYPDQPIRIIVPYGPGGTGDVIGRVVAKRLSTTLKQSVIVENKAGAAGSIGAAYVAHGSADGYTVLLGYPSELLINPIVQKGVTYNVTRDFEPVAMAGTTPLLLVANPSVRVHTIKELVELGKAKAGGLTCAQAGEGSPSDIACRLFAKDAGVQLTTVPYKGGGQAVTDLVAGVVDIYFSGMPPAVPFVKAGKLDALGVTSKASSPTLPEVPPLAARDYPRLDLSGWFGFFVPKGVAADRVATLREQISAALDDAQIRQTLAMQGVQTSTLQGQAFAEFVQREAAKYESLLKEFNVSAD